MGYQESYIKMKDSKDFDRLIETIKSNGKDVFDMAVPVEIITLLKPIKGNLEQQCRPEKKYLFKPGEKFIYVIGERSGQRCSFDFFEYCNNVPQDILDNLEMYFTECFPSNDIFENNEETKIALHEEFSWG
jgi:hypothetical protein